MLSEFLDESPDIEVVCHGGGPYQARDMIIRFNPDVMTLDIEMPRDEWHRFYRKAYSSASHESYNDKF